MLEASYEVEGEEPNFDEVEWTVEEEQNLERLVASSAHLGRKPERWEFVAAELGNGRTVADVRQRWAERQSQSPATPAVTPEPEPQPAALASALAVATASAGAATAAAPPPASSVDGTPPSGWSSDDCRQLGWMVIDAQGQGGGGPRGGTDLWENIASSLVGSRTGRNCRACWLEVLQPEVPGSAFERAVATSVPGTRSVTGSGWTSSGYTLYRIDTRTAIGRLGVTAGVATERRFSEFEAFHAAVIAPLTRAQKLPPIELPPKSVDTWTSKNDPAVVYARRLGLEGYVNAAIGLSHRMSSAALDRALLHFLAAQPGTPPVLPGHDSGSGLWDAAGSWSHTENVDFMGTNCAVPHALTLKPNGQVTFTASGHPAGGKVEAAGIWTSSSNGAALSLSFHTLKVWEGTSFADGTEIDDVVISRKELNAKDKTKPQRASSVRHGQTDWYEVDKGGAVAFRRSCNVADQSDLVARPGDKVRAVRSSEAWVLTSNGLWLPRQFLVGPIVNADGGGLSLPMAAIYRRTITGNEGGMLANALVPVSRRCRSTTT